MEGSQQESLGGMLWGRWLAGVKVDSFGESNANAAGKERNLGRIRIRWNLTIANSSIPTNSQPVRISFRAQNIHNRGGWELNVNIYP